MSRVMGPVRPGTSGSGTDRFDFGGFIDGVISRYAFEHRMTVSDGARQAMIRPALEHEDQLQLKLSTNELTLDELAGYMDTLLNHARTFSSESFSNQQAYSGEESRPGDIDEEHVLEAMARFCPYFPWC